MQQWHKIRVHLINLVLMECFTLSHDRFAFRLTPTNPHDHCKNEFHVKHAGTYEPNPNMNFPKLVIWIDNRANSMCRFGLLSKKNLLNHYWRWTQTSKPYGSHWKIGTHICRTRNFQIHAKMTQCRDYFSV